MEWIKVSERLPKILQSVMVCLENGSIFNCHYVGYSGFVIVLSNHKIQENNKVTHWMPLPKPAQS